MGGVDSGTTLLRRGAHRGIGVSLSRDVARVGHKAVVVGSTNIALQEVKAKMKMGI